MSKEKIIDKLKKLLALSKSSNQHEAELALAKFNELLTTHQLSMSDIDVKEQGSVGEEAHYMGRKGSKFMWQSRLAHACAQLNNSDIIINTRNDGWSIIWVGKKDDITQAKMLYEHLTESWESIFKTYLKERGCSSTKLVRNSHAMGFTSALHTRIKDLVRQREDQLRGAKTTGTALMLLSNQLVKDYIADKYTNLRSTKSRSRSVDRDALMNGRHHGQNIALGGAIK